MEKTRYCDDACPFYWDDYYMGFGCSIFGKECENNKKLDEDAMCYVHMNVLRFLAYRRNKKERSLERKCRKEDFKEKMFTSKNFVAGKGYELLNDDIFFSHSKIYKPVMKGGHRHNHVRNMVIKHMVRGEKNDPRDVLYKKCADFLNQYVNPYRTLNTMIFYAVRR